MSIYTKPLETSVCWLNHNTAKESYVLKHSWTPHITVCLLIECFELVTIWEQMLMMQPHNKNTIKTKKMVQTDLTWECILPISAEPLRRSPNVQSLNTHPHGSMDNRANINTNLLSDCLPVKPSLGPSVVRNVSSSETMSISNEHHAREPSEPHNSTLQEL